MAHYQGQIDWNALAGDDTAFVFIKATEGVSHVDPRFEENWRGARRAGILRGAYHYFTPCLPGRAQAEHFLATVPEALQTLPPVIDAEDLGPCAAGSGVADATGYIIDFIEYIEVERGVRPIIYTTRRFYERHLSEAFADERFWLSDFSGRPDYGPKSWVFWQYTDRGRRRGISGPVDLNVFAGTDTELRALASP
ncbi:MAG: GH25 family lysozyme [Pseudomonadota bacterium]